MAAKTGDRVVITRGGARGVEGVLTSVETYNEGTESEWSWYFIQSDSGQSLDYKSDKSFRVIETPAEDDIVVVKVGTIFYPRGKRAGVQMLRSEAIAQGARASKLYAW